MEQIQDRIHKLSLEMQKKSGMYSGPDDGSDSDQYRKFSLDAHLSKKTTAASQPPPRLAPLPQAGTRRRREGVVSQDYKFQGFKQDDVGQQPCPESTWINLARMSTCAKETKDLALMFDTETHSKRRKKSEPQREAPRNRRISEQVQDRQRFTSTRCHQGALEHGSTDTCPTRRRSTPVRPTLELVRREDVTELMFSISYLPHTEQLTVTVIKARNLARKQSQALPDCYVKVTLMYGEKKIDRKKTSVQTGSINPTFNDSFMFDVTKEDMSSVSLTLTVAEVEHGMVGKCEVGPWTEQWREMMDTPQKPATRWCQMKEITPSCKSPAV